MAYQSRKFAFHNMEKQYFKKAKTIFEHELKNKHSIFNRGIFGLSLFRKEKIGKHQVVRRRNFLKNSIAIHDNIMSYFYEHGQTYPKNVSHKLVEELQLIKDSKYFEFFSDKDLRKLYTTNLAKIILSKMNRKIGDLEPLVNKKSNPGLKYLGFSAHEHSLAAFLVSLQKYSSENFICGLESLQMSEEHKTLRKEVKCFEFPKYSSSLMFELYFDKQEKDYFVKTTYNGKPIDYCSRNGTEYCRIDHFKSFFFKKLMLDDISMLCGNGESLIQENKDYLVVILLMSTVLFFLLNKYNSRIKKE